jgi:hypothetical protein
MKNKQLSIILTYVIAFVWVANGLFCKVLNLVPRHQEIVARILGDAYARPLTFLIGISEVIMALWIISGYKSKWNAWTQILVVGLMNTLEFILVPDLLLWGKFNSVFAFMFILLVYFHEFYVRPKTKNS